MKLSCRESNGSYEAHLRFGFVDFSLVGRGCDRKGLTERRAINSPFACPASVSFDATGKSQHFIEKSAHLPCI